MRVAAILSLLMLAGCTMDKKTTVPGIVQKPFGSTKSGEAVTLFTLTNDKQMQVSIMNYGGIVQSVKTRDKAGKWADVVLGFDTLDGYLTAHPYFGALIGRYGNRIGKGTFTLNGTEYKLATNNNGNHLHGGLKGFDKVVWQAKPIEGPEPALELTYLSKDGEEGYPGNLTATVKYTLTSNNEIRLDYAAKTDKDTVLNLTNHTYWNLTGGDADILGHELTIVSDNITPVDAGLIPTGVIKPVAGSPFDFTQPKPVGQRILQGEEQLILGKGYDHNYVLNNQDGSLSLAARVTEPTLGRVMEVLTTQPGVQFYSGNFLDGSIKGKSGRVYSQRYGLCLETQHYPDSPNKPQFPSVVLKPGEQYKTTTVYRFSWQ